MGGQRLRGRRVVKGVEGHVELDGEAREVLPDGWEGYVLQGDTRVRISGNGVRVRICVHWCW